jgi:hypothetical protein
MIADDKKQNGKNANHRYTLSNKKDAGQFAPLIFFGLQFFLCAEKITNGGGQ